MDENKTNPVVQKTVEEFMKDKSMMKVAEETGISRVTLITWAYGREPDLGKLLKHYFLGTPKGKELSYQLIFQLNPKLAKRINRL